MRHAPPLGVLVVDDSAFMRRVVSEIVESDERFTVVGRARDGNDGLRQVHRLNPDLVTLDLEMPELDGLSMLGYLMSEAPRPVVILSAAEDRDRELTLRALELGAVDFVRKPGGSISLGMDRVRQRLLEALHAAADANIGGLEVLARPPRAVPGTRVSGEAAERAIAVAASTGGPRALADFIAGVRPGLGTAVLVVQHIPRGFTRSLAARLDSMSSLRVVEAEDGMNVRADHAYIAPGGLHMRLAREQGAPLVRLSDGPGIWGVRPAADPLFESVADTFGSRAVGVVLTGMGRDGASGLEAILRAGGGAVVQSVETAVAQGMPRAAAKVTGETCVHPLDRIAGEAMSLVRARMDA